eukprot:GHVT01017375.1.p1 GENE.GHVT01017375.1~~GHVT01017375.1.p1  ORF type:complete len:696 (-),score=79.82 GHVT01017375.1:306-2393(-)
MAGVTNLLTRALKAAALNEMTPTIECEADKETESARTPHNTGSETAVHGSVSTALTGGSAHGVPLSSSLLDEVEKLHVETIMQLRRDHQIAPEEEEALLQALAKDVKSIRHATLILPLLRHVPDGLAAWTVGHGELWASTMFYAAVSCCRRNRKSNANAQVDAVLHKRENGQATDDRASLILLETGQTLNNQDVENNRADNRQVKVFDLKTVVNQDTSEVNFACSRTFDVSFNFSEAECTSEQATDVSDHPSFGSQKHKHTKNAKTCIYTSWVAQTSARRSSTSSTCAESASAAKLLVTSWFDGRSFLHLDRDGDSSSRARRSINPRPLLNWTQTEKDFMKLLMFADRKLSSSLSEYSIPSDASVPSSSTPSCVSSSGTSALSALPISSVSFCLVVPGFVCCGPDGEPSTLGRNGGDYAGSLMAALVQAQRFTIWTDVPGVYTANPSTVPSAFPIRCLSFDDAVELAYFGARVLHPYTMHPCIKHNIPIVLRSALDTNCKGTLIISSAEMELHRVNSSSIPSTAAHSNFADPCVAFTSVSELTLVNVEGTSMIGVPGIACRIFAAVQEAGASVVMISQASSEHSVCFGVLTSQANAVIKHIRDAFHKEMTFDGNMGVRGEDGVAIVCAVGQDLLGRLGILGRLATAMAEANVNIKAVAQGSCERNITFVIDSKDATHALNAMHNAIYPVKRSVTS